MTRRSALRFHRLSTRALTGGQSPRVSSSTSCRATACGRGRREDDPRRRLRVGPTSTRGLRERERPTDGSPSVSLTLTSLSHSPVFMNGVCSNAAAPGRTCAAERRIPPSSSSSSSSSGRALYFPLSLSPTRARARALFVSHSLSASLLPRSRRRRRARHPGNRAPRSARRALAALARLHGAGTEREKSGATHSDEPPILCCGRLAGVVLLVCCYGRLGYGITDRVTRRAVRGARGTTHSARSRFLPPRREHVPRERSSGASDSLSSLSRDLLYLSLNWRTRISHLLLRIQFEMFKLTKFIAVFRYLAEETNDFENI